MAPDPIVDPNDFEQRGRRRFPFACEPYGIAGKVFVNYLARLAALIPDSHELTGIQLHNAASAYHINRFLITYQTLKQYETLILGYKDYPRPLPALWPTDGAPPFSVFLSLVGTVGVVFSDGSSLACNTDEGFLPSVRFPASSKVRNFARHPKRPLGLPLG
jgi:hypothetical protein